MIIALDTNLLLLLVVGLTDRALVVKHKRLQQFDLSDFDVLRRQVDEADAIAISPNVLSEVSNLIEYCAEPAQSQIKHVLMALIPTWREGYIRSEIACQRPDFARLGLSDCVTLELCGPDHLLLSADLDLCVAAESANLAVLNFNHFRLT